MIDKKICAWCKKRITQQELDKGEAFYIFGDWVHKDCDEKEFGEIDKQLKYTDKKREI